jgi:hypothetical protein
MSKTFRKSPSRQTAAASAGRIYLPPLRSLFPSGRSQTSDGTRAQPQDAARVCIVIALPKGSRLSGGFPLTEQTACSRTGRERGSFPSPAHRPGTHFENGPKTPPRFRRCIGFPQRPGYHLRTRTRVATRQQRTSPGLSADFLDGHPSITAMRFAGRSQSVA